MGGVQVIEVYMVKGGGILAGLEKKLEASVYGETDLETKDGVAVELGFLEDLIGINVVDPREKTCGCC